MSPAEPTDIPGRITSAESDGFYQRKAERSPAQIWAGLRPRGHGSIDVRVIELSTHGFRASTAAHLQPEQDVRLRLPGLEPWPARVVWTTDCMMGCEFERPLHPTVLATILKRAA